MYKNYFRYDRIWFEIFKKWPRFIKRKVNFKKSKTSSFLIKIDLILTFSSLRQAQDLLTIHIEKFVLVLYIYNVRTVLVCVIFFVMFSIRFKDRVQKC